MIGMAVNAGYAVKSAMKDTIGMAANARYVISAVMKGISGRDVFVPGVIKKWIIQFIIGSSIFTVP